MIHLHAGHTSTDPGACYRGLQEHRIALAIRDEILIQAAGTAYAGQFRGTPENLDYAEVQDWFLGQPPGTLICLHVNAGGGDYGAVFAALASEHGQAVADSVAAALRVQFGGLDWHRYDLPALGWPRPFACIREVTASPTEHSAILIEHGFLDNPSHAYLYTPDGIRRIAAAYLAALGAP